MIEKFIEETVRRVVREEIAAALASLPQVAPAKPRRLLSVDETAEVLNLSTATIRRMIEKSELRVCRAFSTLRIDSAEIDRWIESAKVKP